MEAIAHSSRTLRFSVFEVDLRGAELRKHGVRVRLQEQPFQILALLLERPGELITREELRQKLWSAHTFVDFDRNLNKAMNKLRCALGDSAESPRFVETLYRRGYRFIAPIQIEETAGTPTIHPTNGNAVILSPEVRPLPGRLPLARLASQQPWGLRRSYVIALAVALVVSSGLAFYLRPRPAVVLGNSPTPRRSVAVLGFKNLAGHADEAWLSTALSDWLTTELSAGEQLRTIPAESVARMRIELSWPDLDTLDKKGLERIGKNLGTDLVVLGSYATLGKESGGQIRLDLRLEDTRNGEPIEAISETGTEARLFDLVSRAGEQLRAKLGVQAITREQAAEVAIELPSNHSAARLYSEGLEKLRVFDALAARDLFQKSIAIEPNYALTHSALATAWATLGYDEAAKEEAKKAFDLSADLPRPERLLVQGRYHEMSKNWTKAVEIYRALFEFYPDSLDYGLALAHAQVNGAMGKGALETVEALQELPPPLGNDPRIDLADASAAESLGDFKRDLTSSMKAADKARALGASLLLARARADQSWALENLGRFDDAAEAAGEAKQLFAAAGDKRGVAQASNVSGIALQNKGEPEAAKKMYEESLATHRQIGNKLGVANDLDNLGDILLALGNLNGSRAKYEESLSTYREIGHEDGLGLSTGALGAVLLAMGDHAQAKRTCEESVEICNRIGDRAKAAIGLAGLGRALRVEGDIAGARKYEAAAGSIFEEIGDRQGTARVQLAHAELSVDEGKAADAALLARRAADEFEREKTPGDAARANAILARAFLKQADVSGAHAAIQRAIAILSKCRDRDAELFVAIIAARVDAASGHRSEASNHLEQVLADARRSGFVTYELEIRLASGELEMDSGAAANGRAYLEALRKDAADRGFGLIAREAAAALNHPTSAKVD